MQSIDLKLTAYLANHPNVIVTNAVKLEYTNDCGFPALKAGQHVGWFDIVNSECSTGNQKRTNLRG